MDSRRFDRLKKGEAMNRFARGVAWLLITGLAGWDTVSEAYDLLTHEAINVAGTLESNTSGRLRDELGLSGGVEETFGGRRVIDWIREGGSLEDILPRPLNHFHHPLRSPWREAGLKDFPFFGESSILWAQTANQGAEESFSWINARQAYLSALVSPTKAKRGEEFSKAFRSLGQIMHLLIDTSVPAHVRNNSHATPPGDPYERLVEREAEPRAGESLENARRRFRGTFATLPFRPDDSFILKLSILGQDAIDAPVPISRLWDSDRYNGTNPITTLNRQIGIGEYTNANFFSKDTVFADQRPPDHKYFSLFPSSADVESFTDPVNNRKYWRKRGATQEEPQHLAVVSKRFFWQQSSGVQLPPRGRLDDKVHEEYARLLLPRAVGYSAALLDYFFRGTLDLNLVEDSTDSSRFQLIGTNGLTSDELIDGTLTLYSDSPSGVRSQIADFSPMSLKGVKPGDPLASSPPSFQTPENAERFVAVYEGTLGQEMKDPARNVPGGVIGKVLGGVRVEEVFSDGNRWKLRTPQNVFLLPLMVAEFGDVRWGDGDSTLVARSLFTPEQAIRAVAFEVQRLPNSIELKTVDTADGPEVQLTKVSEAGFPFSMPAVTTVQFSQTVQYRQQLVRYDRTFAARWNAFRLEYEPVPTEYGPYQIEIVHQQAVPFTQQFPVVLDAAHNGTFGTLAVPYVWDLQEVAVDASGRLFGLVVVTLTSPTIPEVKLPSFDVETSGGLTVVEEVSIFPAFPPGVGPLWVLVDLKDGRLVASTADPTITIISQTRVEGPPWGSVGFATGGIGRHEFVRLEGGGRFDGLSDFGWFASSTPFRQRPVHGPPAEVTELQSEEGFLGISVSGLPGGELKEELSRLGPVGFELSAGTGDPIEVNVNCSGVAVDTCRTLWLVRSGRAVSRSPAQLRDARRSRPAPGGERLVFMAVGSAGGEPDATALSWDPASRIARALTRFTPVVDSFHILGPATRDTVLVVAPGHGSFLIPLEGIQPPTSFPEDLTFSFTLLDPSFLYHVGDLKFYRSKPPLLRTALPAKLADLPDGSNPVGDYHAIRVP